jgi:oxaloacetate decarboxylase alpha subunit
VLKGEYGATPAPVNESLQARVLEGDEPITCRPADLLAPEMAALEEELESLAEEKGIDLAEGERRVDDVLTYALFPQIGLKFLANRGNPEAFEPVPGEEAAAPASSAAASDPAAEADTDAEGAPGGAAVYTVTVNGRAYTVEVAEGGDLSSVQSAPTSGQASTGEKADKADAATKTSASAEAEPVKAPLAGNIFKVEVAAGDSVSKGQVLVILEAMKMETEVRATRDGRVSAVSVTTGDAVKVGDTLLTLDGQ